MTEYADNVNEVLNSDSVNGTNVENNQMDNITTIVNQAGFADSQQTSIANKFELNGKEIISQVKKLAFLSTISFVSKPEKSFYSYLNICIFKLKSQS